jgi:hypothetical protein
MPSDPDSPFAPAGADGIDDWFVSAPRPTGQPNDWIAPWNARTDPSYPDDWIYPNDQNVPAAPSLAPPAPSPQSSAANPAISNRPAPLSDPFCGVLGARPGEPRRRNGLASADLFDPQFSPEHIPASAWVTPPPLFSNSLGQVPLPASASRDIWPTVGATGLLGGVGRMLAERAVADASRDPAANGLLGGIAKLTPASAPTSASPIDATQELLGPLVNRQPAVSSTLANASYSPGSRPFLSRDLIGHQGGRPSYATAGSTGIAPATGIGTDPEYAPAQLAQALPPIFFARPPVLIPRQLAPLEELPAGSAGGPGAGKPFPRSTIEQQPEGVPCTYCGRPTTREPGPDKLHGDHVIPRIQGGNNDPKNFTPACRTCNLEKGRRTPEQWYFWLRGGGET